MPQHDTTTEHAATGALADDTPSTPQQERETTTVSTALATDKPLGFKIQGENPGDGGRTVSAAGDVNGDGIDDVIVAAGPNREGSLGRDVYVVFGSSQGFAQVVDLAVVAQGEGGFKIQGENPSDNAGFSFVGAGVSAAGDVNADGLDDLIVGAENNDGGGAEAGAAYVVFGSDEGFPALVDLAVVAQGQGGFKIQGETPNDQAGGSVSVAGDVNKDGIDDVIVSAVNNSGGFGAGAAYVVFGSSQGFAPVIDLAAIAQGQGGFKIQGQVLEAAGSWVSAAGDINGDGIDDLLVGTYSNPGGLSDAGAAYVIFGSDQDFPALVDLAAVEQGQGGFKIQGEVGDYRTGSSVSTAGDFNGDGIDDLIVGGQSNEDGGAFAGAAYVVFGSSQGFAPIIDLADIAQGQGGFKVQGNPRQLLGYVVSDAGDVNNDGVDDLLVGAPGDNGAAAAVYVIFGGQQLNATVLASEVGTTVAGFKISGGEEANFFGGSVSAAGDIDGDGIDDMIVAAGNYGGGTDAGAAYVIYGSTDPFPAVIDLADLAAPPPAGPPTVLNVEDASVAENEGPARFRVFLDSPATEPVTLTYSTFRGTFGEANFPENTRPDYGGVVDGTVTIPEGQSETFIEISIIDDLYPELDERFELRIESIDRDILIEGESAVGKILDDDPPPGLAVSLPLPFRPDLSNIEVTQGYAAPPKGGNSHFTPADSTKNFGALQWAVDFAVEPGTEIISVTNGQVVDVKSSVPDGGRASTGANDPSLGGTSAIGNFVTVHDVDLGLYVSYLHFEKDGINFKKGDNVSIGDVLGTSGLTGARTGPHLHIHFGSDKISFTDGIVAHGGVDDIYPAYFRAIGTILSREASFCQLAIIRAHAMVAPKII